MRVLLTGKTGFIVRAAFTLVAAWVVFNAIDWSRLWLLLLNANVLPLTVAVPVLAIQFAVMVKRWQITIALLGGPPVRFEPLAIALARGMLIGQPLPSTVGGDIVRAVEVSRDIGLPLAARSVLCDRLIALVALVVLVAALLPLFASFVSVGASFLAIAIVSLGALGALLLLFLLSNSGIIERLIRRGGRTAEIAGDIILLGGKRAEGMLLLNLSFATHLLGVVLIYMLASAVGSPVTLFQALLIVPPTLLISAVPISLGGWGVREGALAAGFALVGASTEAGVAVSILFGLTGPLIGLLSELAVPLLRTVRVEARDTK